MSFDNAIVRPPCTNYADGLTTVDLGVPSYEKALDQHARYCDALRRCGLTLTTLPAEAGYPDSTFVEDAAIVTKRGAVVTRPGAHTRLGEVESIAETLAQFYSQIESIRAPGTVDGGDVCDAGSHFFIGISERTNRAGAEQLSERLAELDYTSTLVDIRNVNGILHLKSGLAYLDNNQLVVIEELAAREEFKGYDLITVDPAEQYAANCVQINEMVLIAAGFPRFEETLNRLGYQTMALEMAEFQKMDGGLSCLSLRF